jgi:membrane protein
MYMPNTRVRFRSALVGGVAGGTFWATVSVIFATFVVAATRTQLIYSGFAVAITTLIWLYLNWLILLIGSQLAFYHQNPAFLRIGRREPRLSNAMRERLALNIMLLVGRAFRKGDTTISVHEVARVLRIPSITLTPIITGLETDGLLTSTEQEDLLPGREMSRILLNDVLAVVRERGETGSYRDPKWANEITGLGEQVDAAVASTVGEQTLSDLLDKGEK